MENSPSWKMERSTYERKYGATLMCIYRSLNFDITEVGHSTNKIYYLFIFMLQRRFLPVVSEMFSLVMSLNLTLYPKLMYSNIPKGTCLFISPHTLNNLKFSPPQVSQCGCKVRSCSMTSLLLEQWFHNQDGGLHYYLSEMAWRICGHLLKSETQINYTLHICIDCTNISPSIYDGL